MLYKPVELLARVKDNSSVVGRCFITKPVVVIELLLYKFYKRSNVLIAIATSFKSRLLTLYKAKEAVKLIKLLVTDALSIILRLLGEELAEASWLIQAQSRIDPVELYDKE